MSDQSCACGCGQPLGKTPRRGLRNACYARWARQGFPEDGPTPPLTQAECQARSRAAKAAAARLKAAEEAEYEPDDYDLAWARDLAARRAAELDNRVLRAKRLAAALIRSVGTGDRRGIATVLAKARDDWEAHAVVLAECADPERAAVACAQPLGPFLAAVQPMPETTEEATDEAA